jgi:hypothetical protein
VAVWNPNGTGGVHVDNVLTNISLGWPALGLVGENLFPAIGVAKQSDKYNVFGREGWLPEQDYRAPGTVANEIPGMQLSKDTYYAQEHSLQIPVTDEERENADSPLSPDRDGTELVTSKIILGREFAMYNYVSNVSNYATGHSLTLSGTSQWSDYTNSDPIAAVRGAIRTIHSKIFMEPNVMVLPYYVYSILQDHPKLLARIQYAQKALITADLMAELFGIDRIIVPGVGIGSGNPGQTMTVSYLWGKDVILAWVPPRPGQKIPAFGYEFVWSYGAGQAGGGRKQIIDRWREDPRKSDLIRCSRRYDLKMVGVDTLGKTVAGYIFKAAVA